MGSYVTKCNLCKSVATNPIAQQQNSELKPIVKLLLLGLDNAGKTTTALHLLGESLEDVIPTIGFSNLEMKKYKQFHVTLYDLGGGQRIRGIWKNYFGLVHGIIFVVDSADMTRLFELKDVIADVISNEKISGKPILFLINKQDIDGALDEYEISKCLNLDPLIKKFKCVTKIESFAASMRPDKGSKIDPFLENGYKWLIEYIETNWYPLDSRVQSDSNDQYSAERKSIEERIKKFRDQNTDKSNEIIDTSDEKMFIRNGDPFRPVKDVVRDKKKTNASNDLSKQTVTQDCINVDSKMPSLESRRSSLLLSSQEIIENIESISEEEVNYLNNEPLSILSLTPLPEDRNDSDTVYAKVVDNMSVVEVHHNYDRSLSNDTEKSVHSGKSASKSQTSPSSNDTQPKISKRKLKVLKSSRVSPVNDTPTSTQRRAS